MSEPSGESAGLPTSGPTNDPAARTAEVERHHPCACDWHVPGGPYERRFCAWCGERWPCLIRRLADENAAIIAAGTRLYAAVHEYLVAELRMNALRPQRGQEPIPDEYRAAVKRFGEARDALISAHDDDDDGWRALGLAVRERERAEKAEAERAVIIAAGTAMAEAIGDCGRPVTDEQLTTLIERYFAWRALGLAAGDGDMEA